MPRREHVVILGGGIAALTTAFALTEQPDWRERYAITVVQMGWRLGGKAASGVDPDTHHRVEEHGLHVWFGFYQNAFALMRSCYAALDRPTDHRLPDAESAFQPIEDHTFLEEVDGQWVPWHFRFSGTRVLPGALAGQAPSKLPGVWGTLHRLLSWLKVVVQEHPRLEVLRHPPADQGWLPDAPPWAPQGTPLAVGGVALIDRIARHLRRASCRVGRAAQRLLPLLRGLREGLRRATGSPELRRLGVLVELSLTGAIGVIADDLARRGYRSVDGEDFRAWLRRHDADEAAIEAPIIRTLYDIFFAFEGGDTTRPAVAAGATLRGLFRLLFGYHGAVLWKMNAGMGDAIVAPLYEVLRARGVCFRFFHEVRRLETDGHRITAIELVEQARVRGATYEPLIDVDGLPCWPHAPRWEQLVDAPALCARGAAALERPGAGGRPIRMVAGADFDRVVLGIPVAALGDVCAELAACRPRWRAMLDGLGSVRTQALQLWFRRDLRGLGATWPSGMVASYLQPFSSWSDFSQVLDVETWPHDGPRYLAYSCGVLPDDVPEDEAVAHVRDEAIRWLSTATGPLWPAATLEGGGFDWDQLHDPRGGQGPERLDAQYVRANTAPSERYTLALPGTTRHRMRPGDSGFTNLVLCGAWTDNDFILSCIEGAVMSGLMAARAVDGRPRHIVGEGDT